MCDIDIAILSICQVPVFYGNNVLSSFLYRTVAQTFQFYVHEILMVSPPSQALNRGGV